MVKCINPSESVFKYKGNIYKFTGKICTNQSDIRQFKDFKELYEIIVKTERQNKALKDLMSGKEYEKDYVQVGYEGKQENLGGKTRKSELTDTCHQ